VGARYNDSHKWSAKSVSVHFVARFFQANREAITNAAINVSQSVATLAHPATAGRHRRSGARQSTPSIGIDNCAEFSINVPPGSTFDGHRKTPCSSRLYLN
jgi:hypothetical protein